ncbi:hypothetical protein TIFTF001_020286 [Ficus carica]|uniref:RNase H type-1 domain-containing protein n=1 Tax=Ficus carica TaxID=3494 RepID=A0AA88ATV2_FICCA|nr:hypothetical protein TIFTF001_020286 [Ficus carica]
MFREGGDTLACSLVKFSGSGHLGKLCAMAHAKAFFRELVDFLEIFISAESLINLCPRLVQVLSPTGLSRELELSSLMLMLLYLGAGSILAFCAFIRDETSDVCECLAKRLRGTFSHFVAECLALREGLEFPAARGMPISVAKSDAMNVIQSVNSCDVMLLRMWWFELSNFL